MIHIKSQPRSCKLLLFSIFSLLTCVFYFLTPSTPTEPYDKIYEHKEAVLSPLLTVTPLKHGINYSKASPIFYIFPNATLHRTPPDIIIGIPTVPRNNGSYIINTLKNILDRIYEEEMHRVVIVISCNYDRNRTYCIELASTIIQMFSRACSEGTIELISYPEHWTPANFPRDPFSLFNLTDPPDRFRWRTKQHTDFIYLMSYCFNAHSDSRYYIQLEDDVVTRMGFVSEIERFIRKVERKEWVILEFSVLGFIGKLFRIRTLQEFVIHDIPLYNQIPIDWSLDEFLFRRFCKTLRRRECVRKVYREHRIAHRPPIFQHIGIYSSLAGKKQDLKERRFNDVSLPLLIDDHKSSLSGATCTDNMVTKDMIYDFYYNEQPLEIGTVFDGFELSLTFEETIKATAIDFRYSFNWQLRSNPFKFVINSNLHLLPPFDDLKNVEINNLTMQVHEGITEFVLRRLTLKHL